LLISAHGGLLGLLIASALLRLVVSSAPWSIPRLSYSSIDGWALCFTFLIVLIAALLSGGWAAARVRYSQVSEDLHPRNTSGSGRDRLRGAIVVTEVKSPWPWCFWYALDCLSAAA
jgi:hypothetical protein